MFAEWIDTAVVEFVRCQAIDAPVALFADQRIPVTLEHLINVIHNLFSLVTIFERHLVHANVIIDFLLDPSTVSNQAQWLLLIIGYAHDIIVRLATDRLTFKVLHVIFVGNLLRL